MTIHSDHPFPTEPDPARRFRGRLGGAVSLWTAGDAGARAGLTVTSLLVVDGPQPAVLGLLDPDSDLAELLLERGRGVVSLLGWEHRHLAEAFAGTAPAPGGPFRTAPFVETPSGPRPATVTTWAEIEVVEHRELGWSVEIVAALRETVVGDDKIGRAHV